LISGRPSRKSRIVEAMAKTVHQRAIFKRAKSAWSFV
jgi:hypothetical protein